MTLSEDVFDDTMPHCEKLYNAEAALQSRFRELVSSHYYQSLWYSFLQMMARQITGNDSTDHSISSNKYDIHVYWYILLAKLYPKSSSCLVWSSSFPISDVQWAFILRCFSLCPFNSRTTLVCLRLISSSDTFNLRNYLVFIKLCSFIFGDLSR